MSRRGCRFNINVHAYISFPYVTLDKLLYLFISRDKFYAKYLEIVWRTIEYCDPVDIWVVVSIFRRNVFSQIMSCLKDGITIDVSFYVMNARYDG